MADRTVVVAAGNLLTKGYQAIPADRTSGRGDVVNALYGVARSVCRTLALKRPRYAVGVIGPLGDGPEELVNQRPLLPRLLEAHGVHPIEADDEATAVARFVQAAVYDGDDVVVLGSDKRFAQLVSDRVWWYDAYKDARYTPEMVVKRFEVPPHKVADWLALVGDDHALPGIKGIGKKSATALLEAYATVEQALDGLDAFDTRTRNALTGARERVAGELARARLDRRGEPLLPRSELAFEPPPASILNALYAELGFFELLATERASADAAQVCRAEREVTAAVDRFGAAPVSVYALTDDPSPVRGALVGLAVRTDDGQRYYFALDGEAVPERLAPWLRDEARAIVTHEAAVLHAAVARFGLTVAGIVGDTASASHLNEPSNLAPHDLPILSKRVARRPLVSEDEVRGTGRRRRAWAQVEVDTAAEYACACADAVAAVWQKLEPTVDRERLREYLDLSETAARMGDCGIAVDRDELERVGRDFEATGASLEEEIFEHARKRFKLSSPKQLGEVLFEDLGLTVLKRTKTGWSTATEALERIQHAHPIVPLVIHHRALERLRNTWVTALMAAIDDDGRVHSTFHIARSFSGRIINSNPDLGRVPGRTEQMQRIRRAFVAPKGRVLLSIDYRQLGLHVLAHLTKDPELVEPLRRQDDMHRLTASAVLQIDPGDVTADQRQLGKVVNFATFAGQGASALSQQLGVTPEEAKQLLERFDRRYRVARSFQDEQLRRARAQGHVVTISGRRWPIGGLESLDPQDRSYAERLARRATHEGSVADVSRRGLLRADQALRAAGLAAFPLLQIHDEVIFEVPEPELRRAAELAAEAMATAYTLQVPLRVGKKAGSNWADLEPLE